MQSYNWLKALILSLFLSSCVSKPPYSEEQLIPYTKDVEAYWENLQKIDSHDSVKDGEWLY
jgi:hypothetical protein